MYATLNKPTFTDKHVKHTDPTLTFIQKWGRECKGQTDKNSWGNEHLGIVIYFKPRVSKQYKHIS